MNKYVYMFHFIFTLAYIIPNVYVFFRIRNLFISKANRKYYTLIYFLLVLVYPMSNLINSVSSNYLSVVFDTISGYLLPFFLYLFLFILLTDIFILFNMVFRIVPGVKIKNTSFRNAVFAIIITLSVIIVVAGAINFSCIRTSEYNVEISSRSSKIRNLKIAFASDFHLKKHTSINFVKRFVKKVNENHADVILFGGDIIEGNTNNDNLNDVEVLLKSLKAKYGVFSVLGNHEHYNGQDNDNFFNRSGLKLLRDTVIVVDSAFNLAGRIDSHSSGRMSVDKLIENTDASLPVILVDHRPTEIDQISRKNVDIQLSGHTHYGQLFPINLIIDRIYELGWGYMKKSGTHVFVSSGIRLWGPQVRTVGKSEIMIININFVTQ